MSPAASGRRPTFASTLPARDFAEMRVAELLGPDGCPLCRARTIAEQRLLDALIGEAVNDVGVRRRLDAAGGFCERHTALLPERERLRRGGTIGTAILLGSVLRNRLSAIDGAVSGGRGLSGRMAALRRPAICPVCADVNASVAAVVAVVAGRLGDKIWTDALRGATFCLADLLLLWQTAATAGGRTTDAWRPIAAAQAERLLRELATAEAYVAHSAHDRQSELTDEERVAADVLVRRLAGETGVGH